MSQGRYGRALPIVLLASLLAACGGEGGGTSPPPIPNPVPSISSLSPASATAGAASQTLAITGTNFLSSSTVTYNGTAHTSSSVSPTQLTISLSATDQATAGTYPVVVTNPSPGGGVSNSANFAVDNPVPSISALSPESATAGGPAFTLTVQGSGFLDTSAVRWNAAGLTTTFVSSTELQAIIPGTDIAAAGVGQVVVFNPGPGGGTSPPATLKITSTQATLTVVLRGPGTGIVTSSPAGINCGTICSAHFPIGTAVTLTATPQPTPFSGWTGDPACTSGVVNIAANTNCTATFNPGPSVVSVKGTQLFVQKRNLDGSLGSATPYVIRGVDWSPASTDTNTSTSDPHNADVRRPEFAKWAPTDVPLIAAMNANTVRLFIDPGVPQDGNTVAEGGWQTLNTLYRDGLMAIVTVDDGISDTNRIMQAVNYYKDHPAVLMFSLGSEWNINTYFQQISVADAAQLTENAAQLVKSLDSDHPVATSYGDIDIDTNGLRLTDTQNYVTTICPTVDVWGLNVYRGDNFGLLFQQWASITTKPMFLGEFGVDAFHTTDPNATPPTGQVNEAEQAQWDLSLWNDLFSNLSAGSSKNVAIGGTVFEFQDEWWKCTPPTSQSTCGYPSGGFPDGYANEDFFGLLDVTRATFRQAYSTLKTAFAPQYNPGPQQISFTAISAGALAPIQQIPCSVGNGLFGFAEFDKGHTRLFQKPGDGCGGRGFNIAAIDPSTGDLLTYPGSLVTFDTYATRNTGQDMEKMVAFLNGLPNGTIVLIAVGDEAGLNQYPPESCSLLSYSWVQDGLQALEALGSTKIANYCYNGSWAMISVKGEGVARDEELGNPAIVSAQATFAIP